MKQIIAWIAAATAALLAVFQIGKRNAHNERRATDAEHQRDAIKQREGVRDEGRKKTDDEVREELRDRWVRRD